ncbi:MAG: hypothetical protein QF562_03850, partial [Verrucomicrobiota bacterium]|nr:hypothetical protein [Verrucomicrobiota bacterium]
MSFLHKQSGRRLAKWIGLAGLVVMTAGGAVANQPKWIWSTQNAKDGETVFFRKAIKLNKETKSAKLTMSCDN